MAKSIKTLKEPYLNMPKRTYQSEEYITLSQSAKIVYMVFLCEFRNDQPDKEIKLSYSQISKCSNIKNDNCISKSLKELLKKEFIFKTTKGGLEKNINGYKMNTEWLIVEKPIYIYFMGFKNTNFIKIGKTKNILSRLGNINNLSIHDAYLLLTLKEDDIYSERSLHKKFQKDKIKGELFNFSDEIKRFIDSCKP